MNRRLTRSLWPLALLLALMAWRSGGCRKKETKGPRHAAITPSHWITPLMTAPPPQPTVTLWKGTTRVPQLPE